MAHIVHAGNHSVKKSSVKQLQIDDITVTAIKKNIKNLYLRVYPADGSVHVSVPKRMSLKEIRTFLLSRFKWIKAKQQQLQDYQPPPTKQFVDGETHYFNGKPYCLKIIEQTQNAKRWLDRVGLDDETITLLLPPDTTMAKRQHLLDRWYRHQLQQALPALVQKYAQCMNVEVTEYRVKKMKTRWGTCNPTAQRIWLSLALAQKPQICWEYIVVHEMAHLLEPSHNARFVGFMDQFMPTWPSCKTLLEMPVSCV